MNHEQMTLIVAAILASGRTPGDNEKMAVDRYQRVLAELRQRGLQVDSKGNISA